MKQAFLPENVFYQNFKESMKQSTTLKVFCAPHKTTVSVYHQASHPLVCHLF